jgi:hypothetical protein
MANTAMATQAAMIQISQRFMMPASISRLPD